MAKYRIEQDLLGKREVPDNVYYGIQTLRAQENFKLTGYRIDRDFIKALGIVKKAAAIANQKTGLLDERRAKAIISASQEVIDGKLDEHFVLDRFREEPVLLTI